MLSEKEYIRLSLESNLFFLRIAKEHTIFAGASLPPKDTVVLKQFMLFKDTFETLLDRTVTLSKGVISPEVLSSGELVTSLTLPSEKTTQLLTGLSIGTGITKRELGLSADERCWSRIDFDISSKVSNINKEAMAGTKAVIDFQTTLLNNILNCKSFSYTYPLMLDHVTREVQYYLMLLTKLEKKASSNSVQEIIETEINWNRIMDEHSKFIRGYLDPSENQLFDTANNFSKELDELLARTMTLPKQSKLLPDITLESNKLITNLRDFKKQGTEGILACKVKAVIPPLLVDHVTREANHYLRLLKSFKKVG